MKDYGFDEKRYLIGQLKTKALNEMEKYIPDFADDFIDGLRKGIPEAINLFNNIIKKDRKNLYIGIWNQVLCFFESDELEELKNHCCNEGKEYLEALQNLLEIWDTATINPNDDIVLERIRLTVPSLDDDNLYIEEMRRTGDYKVFSSITIEQIYDLKIYEKPMSFAIYLKDENKMIGAIELVKGIDEMDDYYLQYYIFEAYQNKGYVKEAINGLVKAAFNKELKASKRTPYRYLSLIENINVRLIRCTIKPDNEYSIHAAEKCGFKYEGTFKAYYYDYNEETPIDMSIYTIRNEAFKK